MPGHPLVNIPNSIRIPILSWAKILPEPISFQCETRLPQIASCKIQVTGAQTVLERFQTIHRPLVNSVPKERDRGLQRRAFSQIAQEIESGAFTCSLNRRDDNTQPCSRPSMPHTRSYICPASLFRTSDFQTVVDAAFGIHPYFDRFLLSAVLIYQSPLRRRSRHGHAHQDETKQCRCYGTEISHNLSIL